MMWGGPDADGSADGRGGGREADEEDVLLPDHPVDVRTDLGVDARRGARLQELSRHRLLLGVTGAEDHALEGAVVPDDAGFLDEGGDEARAAEQ
jgi:hypothetical protein